MALDPEEPRGGGTSADESTSVEPPAPRGDAVFAAGDVVASRYHIVRFIAKGGMGEVYEARDTELAEQLALKTIRGEYATRERLLAKFKREIHVARQVTHPNVCRMYDLGQHKGTLFLTMQLLAGESLAALIQRKKRLSLDEALPIARQIAAGMDAAHRAGVVHRDLKPGNVMLLALEAGTRAVITDFGLARRDNDDPQHDLSLTGEVAGSPAYMAPEQLVEGDVGPAADVYAFGTILFEMVTGVRPFDGGSSISTTSRRLVEDAPSPCDHVPELDGRWERAILRCLERDASGRHASGAEVISALQQPPPRRRRRHVLAIASVSAALVGGVVGLVIVKSSTEMPPAAQAPTSRLTVAVIGFKNVAGRTDTAWISPALSKMFATELGGELRAISAEDVARARVELGLGDIDALDAPALARIRGDLGADIVISGSYVALGAQQDRVRLDVRIQDAKQGQTLAAISEQGDTSELPEVVVRASAQVRGALGLSRRSEPGRLRGSMPLGRDAARLHAEGLDKLHRLEIVSARDSLEQAARLEPDHPIIHAALAEAWAELGYDTRARDQAKLALEHADRLPPSERILVEARYHLAAKEWDAAIAAFDRIAKAAPDDLDAALQLAHAQIAAQRPTQALATLASLHGDARIDLEAARAYSLLTQLPGQRDAAARAVDRADRAGATLLAARARVEHASALLALGEHAKAHQSLDAAERAFKQAHEVRGIAAVTHSRALVLFREGKLDEGQELEAKAATFFRETGSVQPLARALMNLGIFASRRGDPKLAIARFHEAIEVARAADDRWILSLALSSLADTERLGGSLADAKNHEAEALEHARATQSRRAEGYIVQTLGQIALAQADLGDAERWAKATVPLADSLGDPALIAQTSVELGRVRLEANDLLSAREYFERAFAAHTRTAEVVDAAIAETALAEVDLAEGQHADAIAHAAHAIASLADAPTERADALAALARAQLAAGKLDDARATAAKATATAKLAFPEGRVRAAIAIAAVETRDGAFPRARQTLATARTEAEQHGLTLLAMYCERAAAELERDHGQTADGTQRLAALVDQAKTRGLLRLAALATPKK